MFAEKSFIAAVEESFRMYKEHGARSTEKLKPIHKYIAEALKSIGGDGCEVHYLGEDSKELTVASGRFILSHNFNCFRNTNASME